MQGVHEFYPIKRLNSFYRFYDAWSYTDDVTNFINDPTCLVISTDVRALVNWYDHFTIKDMRAIFRVHGLSFSQRPCKATMKRTIMDHLCGTHCLFSIYIFKSLTGPREERRNTHHIHFSSAEATSLRTDSTPIELSDNCQAEDDVSYLLPLNAQTKASVIREWQSEMATSELRRVVCAACAKRSTLATSTRIHAKDIDLSLLRNDCLHKRLLPTEYNLEVYQNALLNVNGMEDRERLGYLRVCTMCRDSLSRGNMPKFALSNWLYYARNALPPDVKRAFEEATLFDRMLVSRARANTICVRFRGTNWISPDGEDETESKAQFVGNARKGLRGNVLVTPRDVVQLNEILPPPPETIHDTMCAIFISREMPTREKIEKFYPVLVRKSRVRLMLQFLIRHNYHYNKYEGFKGFSESNLRQLFESKEDEGIPCSVQISHIPPNDAINAATSVYVLGNEDDDVPVGEHEILMENVGYTMGDDSPLAYRKMTAVAVERCLRGKPYIAAISGSRPLPDMNNPNILSWLFLHLDPWGIGGFHHPGRRVPLTMEDQLSHMIMMDGGEFEHDPEFAFTFFNVVRKRAIMSDIRFRVPLSHHEEITKELLSIDPDIVMRIEHACERNPAYKPSTEAEANVFRVMRSLRLIPKNIPGSDGYKLLRRNEIRAMVMQLGTPTLFVTLNPSDVDNPIVRLFSGEDIVLEDLTRGEDMISWRRQLLAARNPAACALFFHTMISKFIRIILRYGRDEPGLYGQCTGYYGTVEAQGRGTLHCHMLIWLKGHLSPQALRDRMMQSDDYKNQVFRWLESIISCEFPSTASGTVGLQTGYTRRIRCRELDNPHPGTVPAPSIEEYRLGPEFWSNFDGFVVQLLNEYSWHVHQPTCWKYLKGDERRIDANCRMGMDGTTRSVTSLDPDSMSILLRRLHPKIANYTDVVVFLMKCNMDIKFIGSGEASKALLYYVTDYITKSTLSLHAGIAALLHAIRKVTERNIENTRTRTQVGPTATSAMITAVNSMMGRHEISQPQVMSYLIGGGDHYTSHKFRPSNWGSIVRGISWELRMSGENYTVYDQRTVDERQQFENSSVTIRLQDKNVTVSSLTLDYMYRCTETKFEMLCLYDFFSKVQTKRRRVKHGETCEEDIWAGCLSSWEHPQRGSHYQLICRDVFVPVLLGPSFVNPNRSSSEREVWARDMLILFKPWRKPMDLKTFGESWLDAFTRFESDLTGRQRQIIKNMNVLTECRDARTEHVRRRKSDNLSVNVDGIANTVNGFNDELYDGENGRNNDYIFDSFVRIEDDSAKLDGRVDSVIGEETSRLLDLCLPEEETITERCNGSNISDADVEVLVEHASIMAELGRRRWLRHGRDDDPIESRNFRRHREPATLTATLQSTNSTVFSRSSWLVVQQVINEMSLMDNPEQLRAFHIVANHLLQGNSQLLMYIAGVGGTGKSHVIRSIVKLFEVFRRREELHLGAPTGIAAVLIGGNTLHALTLLSPGSKSKDIANLASIWRGVRYLIVDEVSMLGARFLSQLSSRLCQAKGDEVHSGGKPFGGVNVIFTGDFGQLKPPKQHALYSHELVAHPSFAQSRDERGISALNGVFLWRQVGVVVELVRNQRHARDPEYAAFLSRLRVGECLRPVDGGYNGDLNYISTRLLSNLVGKPLELVKFRDAPIIVGSKLLRDALNAKLIAYHARRLGQSVEVYYSRDSIRRNGFLAGVQEGLWNLPSTVNREAFGKLPLFLGMRVMVTENIAMNHGVVNGAEGTVMDIKFDVDNQGRRYAKVVYVHLPGSGICIPGLTLDVVPLFPVSVRIEYKFAGSTGLAAKGFSRKQVPIVPAYAYTDFKSQGRTLDVAIVDLASARGQGVYVMLSRVKAISGLVILRWFPPTKIFHRLPQELRDELSRINRLNESTQELDWFQEGLKY